MTTMLAAYLPGNSTVDLREIPVPSPGIGEVRLKMSASGICGSDIKYIYHEHVGSKDSGAAYLGVVAGHEPCGVVEARGQGCRHFKEGDRVLVYHISGCGFCLNCRRGYQISCTDPKRQAYGWQRDGGHAEYMIATERDLIRLPDILSFEDGCFISCGVGTAYEGILRANVSGSDNVLVVGLGPVGMAALMLAGGRGAKRRIGVDTQASRVASAKELGLVDEALVVGPETLGAIETLTAGGADVALDCSGSPKGRLLALQATATWGRCVFLGEQDVVQFRVSEDLMHQQRQIIGSWVTSLYNMEKCCRDLADWGQHPDRIVTHRLPLTQAAKAYEIMADGQGGKVVIVPE